MELDNKQDIPPHTETLQETSKIFQYMHEMIQQQQNIKPRWCEFLCSDGWKGITGINKAESKLRQPPGEYKSTDCRNLAAYQRATLVPL